MRQTVVCNDYTLHQLGVALQSISAYTRIMRYVRNDKILRFRPQLILAAGRMSATTLNKRPMFHHVVYNSTATTKTCGVPPIKPAIVQMSATRLIYDRRVFAHRPTTQQTGGLGLSTSAILSRYPLQHQLLTFAKRLIFSILTTSRLCPRVAAVRSTPLIQSHHSSTLRTG